MKRQAWASAGLLFAALVLGACSKQAGDRPNVPEAPANANAPQAVAPATADSPQGGPAGVAGTSTSSAEKPPPGTTGQGLTAPSQPGIGLNGGLGTSGAASAPVGVPPGSSNASLHSSVGNRP